MSHTLRITLFDDDPGPALEQLQRALELLGKSLDPNVRVWDVEFTPGASLRCEVRCVETLEEAKRLLTDPAGRQETSDLSDMVLVDNNWSQAGGGADWGLSALEVAGPVAGSVNAMFTIAPGPEFVARAIEVGVHSLVSKNEEEPFHLLNLFYVAIQQKELHQRREEDSTIRKSTLRVAKNAQLASDSPRMQRCLEQVFKYAPISDLNILLLGETGTGKTWLAKQIHDLSPRSEQPFEPIDFGQIPEDLAASVLFGHEKGAFTGADAARPGIFERAQRGTVFIDEIHSIPPSVRQALLKVTDWDDGTYRRVGSSKVRHREARIIYASNRPPEDLRRRLADLYPRLATGIIDLPPLRERQEDIEPLSTGFLAKANARFRPNGPVVTFDDSVWHRFQSHSWPDNIRELRSTIDRTVLAAESDLISETGVLFDPASRSAHTVSDTTEFSDADRARARSVRPRRGQQQNVFDLIVQRAPEVVSYADLNDCLDPPSGSEEALDDRLHHLLSRIRGRLRDVDLELERNSDLRNYRLRRAYR
jgi:DNA-binding NtrC family response regulator